VTHNSLTLLRPARICVLCTQMFSSQTATAGVWACIPFPKAVPPFPPPPPPRTRTKQAVSWCGSKRPSSNLCTVVTSWHQLNTLAMCALQTATAGALACVPSPRRCPLPLPPVRAAQRRSSTTHAYRQSSNGKQRCVGVDRFCKHRKNLLCFQDGVGAG
jgi:hypothetical protein